MSKAVIRDALGNHVEVDDMDARGESVVEQARSLWNEMFTEESA